ncbi:MAG: TRC40/GET3/ArsA family transport-energizing ATPase [Rectinema subterraneum]|uniref:TRC40/GET3/ArsA family transport-energizing ATPase n=1 Tax=Rectinema subterraneum TaxID=2653714 RepID=UPI003C7E4542
MGDPSRTDFVFVLQPEGTSLYETKRSKAELEGIVVKRVRFIVNGILPKEVCTHPFFRSRYAMQQKYLSQIRQDFKESITSMYQRDGEIRGIESLRAIALGLYGKDQASGSYRLYTSFETLPQGPLVQAASLFDLINPTPGKTKAVFFTGKGGVGKTTVSTAVAYGLGQKGYKTLLLTTDPASHIGQVLQQSVGSSISKIEGAENLWATMIDQKQAAEEYKARIIADAEKKYSPDMLAAVREELESPCTEEMAAFDKFMGYVESDEYDVVVFDTAPTGHTLRLIELPFDYQDQVGMMVATTAESANVKSETQHRFEKIIARMKDPEHSLFAFVVYPESTPVVEAYRAMLDLKDAGIETKFVVANQVLPAEICTNEFFMKRRAMQVKYLAEIETLFKKPIAVMQLLDTEITGLPMVAEVSELLLAERETESA